MKKFLNKIKDKCMKHKFLKKVFLFFYTLFIRFNLDRITVEASHLAYVTLLSLVPIITVLFSVLTWLPAFDNISELKQFVFKNFVPTSSDVLQENIDIFTKNASNSTIIGVLSLFLVSMLLIGAIDKSINHIWRCKNKRSSVLTISVYWMVITMGPLMFGTSLALTSYLVSLKIMGETNILASFQSNLLKVLPIFFASIGLFFLYAMVPNRKTKISYAVIAAIVAAIILELGKRCFSLYIIYFPSYQNIYGALACIPILLVWIYLSWVIIFLGVEIHAALQNIHDLKTILKILRENSESISFDNNDYFKMLKIIATTSFESKIINQNHKNTDKFLQNISISIIEKLQKSNVILDKNN